MLADMILVFLTDPDISPLRANARDNKENILASTPL